MLYPTELPTLVGKGYSLEARKVHCPHHAQIVLGLNATNLFMAKRIRRRVPCLMGEGDHAADEKCCENDDDEHGEKYATLSHQTMHFLKVSLN